MQEMNVLQSAGECGYLQSGLFFWNKAHSLKGGGGGLNK